MSLSLHLLTPYLENSRPSCPVPMPVPHPMGCPFTWMELVASSLRTGSRLDSFLWPPTGCTGLGTEKGLTECLQTLARGHTVGEQQDQGLNPGPLCSCPGLLPRSKEQEPRVGGLGWRTSPREGSSRPEDMTHLISVLCLRSGGRIKLSTAHVLHLPVRHGLEMKNEQPKIQSSLVQRLAGVRGGGTAPGRAYLIFIGS